MKLILFDVDGTLVDSQDFIIEAQRRTFAAHQLEPPSRDVSLSVVGLSLVEAFFALTRVTGATEGEGRADEQDLAERMAQTYREAWRAMREDPAFHDPPFPGAREAVAALAARADVLLGLATGKSRRGVAHLLDAHGWRGAFATVQTADDHPSKPAPDMILAAMAETGAAPAATTMVGDTTYDMAMAAAAGVHAVGVAWGYHKAADLRAAGAGRIVADFEELLHMLNAADGGA